jgi:hypothetical protein
MPGFTPRRQKRPPTTVLGVVVGDNGQPTTIVAVRYDPSLLTPADPLSDVDAVFETHYTLLNREELKPTLSYPLIAARVNTLARRLHDREATGDYHVLVDASDVGRPVIDSIRFSILPAVHVTSVRVKPDETADLSILWRNDATVGLAYLISRLRAILQGQRLHVPASLTTITEALASHTAGSQVPSQELRALALACASEFRAVTYDVSPDELGSPDF